ncbi:MAG: IPT/TIG domain-containing protein, partial [Thermoleophilia bacterium]
MDGKRGRGIRRLRHLGVLVLALGTVAVLGVAAPRAAAYGEYEHGGITACDVCHLNGHTEPPPPVSEVCNTCHPGYRRPLVSLTCWSCHAPGQDMSAARDDAACTTSCHLPDGTVSTPHVVHTGGSAACSTCHPLSVSLTDPGGSPHHAAPPAPVPTVAGFLPASGFVGTAVTVSGTGFSGATAVTFGGAPAAAFTVLSSTRISAAVPAGALSGVVCVITPAGTGASAASFTVLPTPAPAVTSVLPASGRVGALVTITGTGFTGATTVAFNGIPATAFAVVSGMQITATVPAGATSGSVSVSTPAGTGTSPGSFTVLVTAKLTLKVSPTAVLLGRSVKATGQLAPLRLAGSRVRLLLQVRKGTRWVTLRTLSVPTGATGSFIWMYRPGRRGTFHIRASIAATATHTAAATKWIGFRV